MSSVNNEIRETVQTTEYVIQSVVGVWHMLPIELNAYILTMFTISILMQWVKKSFLMGKTKKEKVKLLWMYSFPLGVALSIAGFYLSNGEVSLIYWAVIGLTVSTAAMGVHKLTKDYVIPLFKLIVTAVYNRLYVMVTGKPRG